MGSCGSKVGSWVRASQSLPPYGIMTPPWQDVAAHAAHTVSDHQWQMHHERGAVFLSNARQHSKKPCTQQSRSTSATLSYKMVQRLLPPLASMYPPKKPL